MNVQQPTDAPRIPLVVAPENRLNNPETDSRLINAFVEKGPRGEGDLYVVTRPGLGLYASLGVSAGKGIYNWRGNIYSIFGNVFYKDGVSKGNVDTTAVYTFDQVLGETPKLFFHNGVKGYTYDDTNGLVEEPYATTVATTGDLHSTVIIDGIPSTASISVNAGVAGNSIPDGVYVVSVDSANQVTISAAATATVAGVSLTFHNPGFPATRVRGSAYLDGTLYVMTEQAKIFGSDINDPRTWSGLNYLTAQIEPDRGVALAKQLVYVIAMKEWSTEVFYDAGNDVGSPLSRVQGAKVNYGCRHGASVQDNEGALFWVGGTRSGEANVMKMDGVKGQQISYPAIDRLVQNDTSATVYSWNGKVDGHRFYGVTFKERNITLVYDVTMNLWYQWTDVNGNYWPIVSSTLGPNGSVLVQHETNGKIYTLDGTHTRDDASIIPVDIYAPSWDGGSKKGKTLNWIDFVGDQKPGQVLQVRCNDFDYDPAKWSNFREVDMGRKRPRLTKCGTFNRRAYHIRCRSPVRMRIQALEVDVDLGTV